MAQKFQERALPAEILENLNPPSLQRGFIFKKEITDSDQTINVLQWNILAQALSYPEGNFNRVEKATVNYETRKWRVLEQIVVHNPDLIALEEVDIYNCFLAEHLPIFGYQCFFSPKPNSRCLTFEGDNDNFKGADGVLLCFRKDSFDLHKQKSKPLPDDGRFAKQIFAILELVHKKSKLPIIFVGTHFKAKSQFSASRMNQSVVLNQYLNEHYSSDVHIILAGDFNGEKNEPFYKVLQDSQFRSSQQELNGRNEPSFTTWKFKSREGSEKEERRTIDYIFFRSNILQPVGYLEIPSQQAIGQNALPCSQYPSDHIALHTVFLIPK